MRIQAAEKVIDILIEAEIGHFFGLPGGFVMNLYEAMFDRQDRIKAIVPRDEQTASCMAEMYGKLTRRPGVFAAQAGFAGSTGLFGVIEALLASTPMLVLTEMSEFGPFAIHAPFQSGTGEYGSFDLPASLRHNTKFMAVAHYPREAVLGVQLALKHALSGRPGPSACIFRSNAIGGSFEEEGLPAVYETERFLVSSKTCPPDAEIERAADLLVKAERPVLIAGNGLRISGGFQDLKELAEVLGAPVVTSYLGKSAIPETHPLAAGTIGFTSSSFSNDTLSLADVILVIGCRLKPQETCFESTKLIDPKRQRIIQIDIDPRNASWTIPVDVALIGDASLALRSVKKAIDRREKKYSAPKRIHTFQDLKEKRSAFNDPVLLSKNRPIYPQRVVRELEEVLPEETILCTDGGNNRHWMNHFFRTKRQNCYFGTGGLGGVSWSLPAALTAKILYPERPSVGVCGDGGFAMQMHVLLTALQYQVAPIYVVMNNACFGMTGQSMGDRSIGCDLIDVDFAAIARSCGCFGERVDQPGQVGEAVRAALGQNKPAVVDVVIDRDQSMKGTIFSPLASEVLKEVNQREGIRSPGWRLFEHQ